MEADQFLVSYYYDLVVIVSHIAIMALLIFMMDLSRSIQIGLLIGSALIFGGMFRSSGSGDSTIH